MSEMIDQSPQEAPELVTSHFAIKKRGVGEKVNIWACEVGAQPASIGADMVVDTDPRGDDPNAILVEDANGSVRPRNAAEEAAIVVMAKVVEINDLRDRISNDAFYHDGHWYWCDIESKIDVLGSVVDTESALQPELPVDFLDTDGNEVALETVEAVMQWGRALRKHRQAAVKAAKLLKTAVQAGAAVDINHPEAVNAVYPWPQNRIIS